MRLLWSISRWVEDILCISPLIKEEERTGRGFSGFTENLPKLEPMSSLINFLTRPPPVTCVQCFTTIFVTTKGIAFIGFSPTSFMFLPHHQSYGWQAVEWIYWLACWFFRWLLGCVTAFVWLPLLSSGLKKKSFVDLLPRWPTGCWAGWVFPAAFSADFTSWVTQLGFWDFIFCMCHEKYRISTSNLQTLSALADFYICLNTHTITFSHENMWHKDKC